MTPARDARLGPHVGIVLPAHNVAANLPQVLAGLRDAIEQAPVGDFLVHVIDDGSTDQTYQRLAEAALAYHLPLQAHRNVTPLGLTATTKEAYGRLLADHVFQPTHLLKLDADMGGDEVASVVLSALAAAVRGAAVVVGGPSNDLAVEGAQYERHRAEDLARVIRDVVRWPEFSPTACGVQCYEVTTLRRVLAEPIVEAFTPRWGLDALLALVARGRGLPVALLPAGQVSVRAECRTREMVAAQYDAFIEIVAALVDKPPTALSLLYGKG